MYRIFLPLFLALFFIGYRYPPKNQKKGLKLKSKRKEKIRLLLFVLHKLSLSPASITQIPILLS